MKTALVVGGGLFLAWLTVESAFKPFLDRLRGAVSRSTDPAHDPDEDTPAAAVPEEDTAAVTAAVATAVAEEKDPAVAAAEPSAPPLPAEEEIEKKGENPVAAKAE